MSSVPCRTACMSVNPVFAKLDMRLTTAGMACVSFLVIAIGVFLHGNEVRSDHQSIGVVHSQSWRGCDKPSEGTTNTQRRWYRPKGMPCSAVSCALCYLVYGVSVLWMRSIPAHAHRYVELGGLLFRMCNMRRLASFCYANFKAQTERQHKAALCRSKAQQWMCRDKDARSSAFEAKSPQDYLGPCASEASTPCEDWPLSSTSSGVTQAMQP